MTPTPASSSRLSPPHPLHEAARAALQEAPTTRLPALFRAEPALVAEYLRRRYPGSRLVLPAAGRRSLVGRLVAAGVAGGRSYDALIGVTATEAGRELLTCDKRAVSIYERLGVRLRLIG